MKVRAWIAMCKWRCCSANSKRWRPVLLHRPTKLSNSKSPAGNRLMTKFFPNLLKHKHNYQKFPPPICTHLLMKQLYLNTPNIQWLCCSIPKYFQNQLRCKFVQDHATPPPIYFHLPMTLRNTIAEKANSSLSKSCPHLSKCKCRHYCLLSMLPPILFHPLMRRQKSNKCWARCKASKKLRNLPKHKFVH